MRRTLRPSTFAFALAAVALAAACGSDNGTNPRPRTGTLTVQLTDGPTDEVNAINVYVRGLTVKPAGGPVERIANDVGLVDLLTLQGTTTELVSLGVEAGTYEYIQVELDESRSNVVEITSHQTKPLQIASQEVKVLGGFTVTEASETQLTLDFDAEASLRHLGNGDWLLTPVILQVNPPATS